MTSRTLRPGPRRRPRAWSGRTCAAVGTAVATAVAALGLLAAPPASAASYRYWTYWWGATGASSWAFAGTGPGSHVPVDGAVEGWRFQTTPSASGGRMPADGRSPASVFAELCGAGTTPAGSKRVAVLLDYGTAADAPPGQSPPSPRLRGRCLTVPPATTGATLLAKADASLRFDSGLLCAIDGYPRGECAPVVATGPTPSRTPRPTASTPRPTSARPTSAASTSPPTGTVASPRPAASTSAPPPTATASAAQPPATSPGAGASAAPTTTASAGLPPAGGAPVGTTTTPPSTPIATGAPLPVDGGSGAPWGALLGLLVVVGLGGVAAIRMRGGS